MFIVYLSNDRDVKLSHITVVFLDLQIIPNENLDLSITQYHVFPFEQAAMSGRFKTLHKRFEHFK